MPCFRTAQSSIQNRKWARLDSNQRPRNYEFPALTTAPRAPVSSEKSNQWSVTSNWLLLTDNWSLNQRAGDGIRTHEYQLGRLMPYHLATPACERHFTTIKRTFLSHRFHGFSQRRNYKSTSISVFIQVIKKDSVLSRMRKLYKMRCCNLFVSIKPWPSTYVLIK